MSKRRNYATLFFVIVLVFFAGEVFALFTAKSNHDYSVAKNDAEELSVELGLISSAFRSGNKTLYAESISRYRGTIDRFADNEYTSHNQAELVQSLREYSSKLDEHAAQIDEFLELSASLSTLRMEMQLIDSTQLDAANFYQIQQVYQSFRDSLDKLNNEDLKETREQFYNLSNEISDLAKSAAICVSICNKGIFDEKSAKLASISEKYSSKLDELGQNISKQYDPSELIVRLNNI